MFKISLIIILSIVILKFSVSNIINTQTVTILLGNYEIHAQQGFILLLAVLFFLALIFIIYFFIGVKFFARHKRIISTNHKTTNALDHIIDCVTLTNLGDYNGSQKALKQIHKNLAGHPIVNLLNIQSHNIVKNTKEINKNFTALLNNQKTRNFALQGLALVAQKNNNLSQAEHYLEESYQEVPYAQNTILALLDNYQHQQNWPKLIKLINENYKKRTIKKGSYDKNLSLAYLMLYLQPDQELSARNHDYLLKAKKLNNKHHQIEIAYAKYLYELNKKSALTKYIKNIWLHNTSPQIIELFLNNFSTKKPEIKLKNLKTLIDLNPKGEAAIVKFVAIVITHKIKINECAQLLNDVLKSSNSYAIYEIALEFYNNFPNDENNLIYDNLLKQEDNYYFKPYYLCNHCNSKSDSWNLLCTSCTSYDMITYHGYVNEKIIKPN